MFYLGNKENNKIIYAMSIDKINLINPDSTIWEEIEGELPEGYELYKEKPILTGSQLESIVRSKFNTMPADNRYQLYKEVESVLNFIKGDMTITESEFEFNYNLLKEASSLPDTTLEQLKAVIIKEILEGWRWSA